MSILNTLRENLLLSLSFSPFGRDRREGAGCENSYFNSLLGRVVWFRGPIV